MMVVRGRQRWWPHVHAMGVPAAVLPGLVGWSEVCGAEDSTQGFARASRALPLSPALVF